MNIFDEVFKVNSLHPYKRAMSIRMDDGTLRVYTYGDMFTLVDKYAENLKKAGLKKGDRIAFVSEGCPEWTIAFLASCKLSLTATLLDASLTGDELREFIEFSDVRGAFFSEKVYKKMEGAKEFLFPVFSVLNGELYEDSIKTVSSKLPKTPDPDMEIACIIFSSGTTRRAAGIMHNHDNLINTTKMTIDVQHLTGDSRFLAIIPNSHIYGVICIVLGPLLIGADVHYIESLSADAVLGAFKEYHPTVLPAVPKVYELFMTQIMRKINGNPVTALMFKKMFPICLKKRHETGSLLGKKVFKTVHEAFGGSLEFVCSAGAPLNRDVAEFYYGTGFNILITYGASETNIPTIGNRPEDIQTDSCGVPYPDVNVRLSENGELLIKSPYMMKGYFRDPEATKEAFTEDGWFKTGDLGEQDEKGYIRITGRSKENIVLPSGKKITPDDLEKKYAELEGVKEFVICGVPNKETNYDEIHAFVVPEGKTNEDFEKIKAQIKEIGTKLVQNMRITKTHFMQEIPKTSLQKPKRYLLKQHALSNLDEVIKLKRPSNDTDDMTERVIEIVAKITNAEKDSITAETKLFSELALDSLSSIDLALELESIYKTNIESYYYEDMTVNDIVLALQNKAERRQTIGQDNVNYPQEKSESDYITYAAVRNLAKMCYDLKVHNLDKIPTDKGFIICSNHVTKIDYLFLSSAFPKERMQKLCCMAKKELFRGDPFTHKLIKTTGMVPVDRGGINAKTMSNLCERLHDNWGVIIHPEGTRSEDGIFREMKSGAVVLAKDAGVPIIPAYINGAFEIFPKDSKVMKLFDWKNKKRFPVDVTFGDPIYPDDKSVEEYKHQVETAILKLQDEAKSKK